MRKCSLLTFALALHSAATSYCQDDFVNSEHHHCGLIGSATSQKGKALNKLKNRFDPPAASEIDSDVTLDGILTPGDDIDRFDDSKAAKIVGYVVDVKVGGTETCNCGATH